MEKSQKKEWKKPVLMNLDSDKTANTALGSVTDGGGFPSSLTS